VRAFVALGANLENPVAQVRSGARALASLDRTRRQCCSSLYRTAPIGMTDQPAFINAVCELDTELTAPELMAALLDIERAHGRVRDQPGGPRTLDLDLLWYDGRVLQEPALTLPHPRLHERAFVLYPLYEIAPGLEIPGRGRVEELLTACRGQGVERLAEQTG
jgi:2-amino-4-hydroxy-6-hydroxymethyldihydropteridine diphosphokinase